MWFWYTIIVMITWGVGDVVAKKGLKQISPVWNNLLAVAFAVCGWIPFALSRGATFSFSATDLLLSGVIALLYLTYYYAIAKGKLILTATLLSTYQATAFVLAVIFLHEQNTILQWIAVALIITGTFLISMEEFRNIIKSNLKSEKSVHTSWILWGLFGGLCNGVGDFLSKISVVHLGPYNFLLTLAIAYVLVNGFNIFLDPKGFRQSPFKYPRLFWYTFIGTGFVELGLIALFIAFEQGPASLVSPLASSSIIVTVILASVFLKEKVTKWQVAGVATTIGGILLLGY